VIFFAIVVTIICTRLGYSRYLCRMFFLKATAEWQWWSESTQLGSDAQCWWRASADSATLDTRKSVSAASMTQYSYCRAGVWRRDDCTSAGELSVRASASYGEATHTHSLSPSLSLSLSARPPAATAPRDGCPSLARRKNSQQPSIGRRRRRVAGELWSRYRSSGNFIAVRRRPAPVQCRNRNQAYCAPT